jgi:hypothetical protein
MKTQERVALLFGLSFLGMGGMSYMRGRRGVDLLTDTALYGLAVGTAVNGAWWMAEWTSASAVTESNPGFLSGFLSSAVMNGAHGGMGALSSQAVKMLSQVNSNDLYSSMKAHGVKVAPVPDDPNVVTQDSD